jgi:hypothetical protein
MEELRRCRLLGWQSDTEESGMDDPEEREDLVSIPFLPNRENNV